MGPRAARRESRVDFKETTMGKGGRKRRSRRKSAANHGKRPNA
ncbi:MAG TPA: hypothetical protein PLL50_06295 [Propionicimonas sp.]|nr:hypothetical protein [Propionicimonas sp.]HQD96865.1 hypothetical protein [Propionicimonas sp.]